MTTTTTTQILTMAILSSAIGYIAHSSSYPPIIITTTALIITSFSVYYYYSYFMQSDTALDPNQWRSFPVIKINKISHNTCIYTLQLQTPTTLLGINIGQHVSVQAEINNEMIMRSYTPVSLNDQPGVVDLLIKSYPQGNLSKFFANLKVGDSVSMRGPKGLFVYAPNMCKDIGMVAGGTGLTPMLQVIKAILLNPMDKTCIKFIFANVNVEDILLKEELDQLADKFKSQFTIHYVLNNPPEKWTGGVGFVTKEMISQYLPTPATTTKLLLCGPPPMIKAVAQMTLDLGFEKTRAVSKPTDQVFKF